MGLFTKFRKELNLAKQRKFIETKLEFVQKQINLYPAVLIVDGWSQDIEDKFFNNLFLQAHLLVSLNIIVNEQPEAIELLNEKLNVTYVNKIMSEAKEHKTLLGPLSMSKFSEEMGLFFSCFNF